MSRLLRRLWRWLRPGCRCRLAADLLSAVQVNEFYHRTVMPTISEHATAKELKAVLSNEEILFPLTVINAHGVPCGILTMGNVRPVYFDDTETHLFLVKDMAGPLVTCTGDESMAAVRGKFESSGYSRIPVVSAQDPHCLLGYIQYQDVMAAYETELSRRLGA